VSSCGVNINENQVLTSFKELFVDLGEMHHLLPVGERITTNPTLAVGITMMPAAPEIFSSNQSRSYFLSSGHTTI
jgi:hypothetical protein